MKNEFWQIVREHVVGANAYIDTPFGKRVLLYADHTASGRAVSFIEEYVASLFPYYGNTHTDDDFTGNFSTSALETAMSTIKRLVHAGDHHKLILAGSGATGAIERLQQILGVYIPPATRERLGTVPTDARPVVFVGPYEHHSNEVTWRECFAEVVEIGLTTDGLIDLEDLEQKLENPAYQKRQRIGSFSAASNVSGVRSDVYAIARILHKHGALAFFDFAALAPYASIDVNRDKESYFDAIFFSPHKFIGGPGSSGILIIHDGIYRSDLPPTHGGGGTVDFVNQFEQHYLSSIEGREMAGTPGIPQVWKAALVMELKEAMNPAAIEERERELTLRVHQRISSDPNIEIIGTAKPENRIGILSFLIRDRSSYLHPRFVARLLNDLFGIQSRGGCSCAGPYGHRLLSIGDERSEQYRRLILQGKCGMKPGWTRVSLHFLMTDAEIDFLCDALIFVAREGRNFLPLYAFDIYSGSWRHLEWNPAPPAFGLDQALSPDRTSPVPAAESDSVVERLRAESMSEARRLSRELGKSYAGTDIGNVEESPFPFEYYEKKSKHPETHR